MCQRVGWGGEECVRGWEGEVRMCQRVGGRGEECVRGWDGG